MSEHTILFVDDEENILRTIKRLFFEEGYRIVTANSGQQALDLISGGETPSVIVSDQRMPQMSGAEFLVKAREKLPQSIRMVLTGYADVNAAVDAINLGGIYRYILKPWNDDDLKLTVREAVERFELVEQNKRLTRELQETNTELAELNESLEEKVKERTLELQEALSKNQRLNVALSHKVNELEGRDRIQQHLLTIHPLEETLQLVLEVIGELVPIDAAAIFLAGQSLEEIRVAAMVSGLKEAGSLFEDTGAESIYASYAALLRKSIDSGKPVVLHREDILIGDEINKMVRFAVLPIQKGERPLGAIVIVRTSEEQFSEANLRTIGSMSMQAAIAISDSLLQQDLPSLEGVLDDVLMDLS